MKVALRKANVAPRPLPLDVFTLRCWGQAYLCWVGELDFHDTVDALQAEAEAKGLVSKYGQDRIQQVIAAGFAEGMPRCE